MPSSKAHRLLDLIALLSGRRLPVLVDEIMERIPGYAEKWRTGEDTDRKAALRKFERDKEALRALGVPVETVPAPTSPLGDASAGYRIQTRDLYMPYLRLLEDDSVRGPSGEPRGAASHGSSGRRRWSTTRPSAGAPTVEVRPEEATAALEGLAHVAALPDSPLYREARSAFCKLAFDLDPCSLMGGEVLLLPPPGNPTPRHTMEALADALLRGKRLTFEYSGIERNETSKRTVEPYGLFLRRGRWYLAARDPERDAVRVFRADRMAEVAVNTREPGSSDFEIPGNFDLGALAGRRAWELGRDPESSAEVLVRFRSHPRCGGARERPGSPVGRDGDWELHSLTVGDARALVRWILGLGGEAEIVGPDHLLREFRASAARIATFHAPPESCSEESDRG